MDKNIEKNMNLKEYEAYCRNKYANFFYYLDSYNNENEIEKIFSQRKSVELFYYFEEDKNKNKKLIIKPKLDIFVLKSNEEKNNLIKNELVISDIIPDHTSIYYFDVLIANRYPEKTLANNLYIENKLIMPAKTIEYFGKNTILDGDLEAEGCCLKSFENIIANKNVNISGTLIKRLPDNLIVKGVFNISKTEIKTTGKNTHIYGNFIACDSEFKELRTDLIFHHNNKFDDEDNNNNIKYINLSNTKITNIPNCFANQNLFFIINNIVIQNIGLFYQDLKYNNKKRTIFSFLSNIYENYNGEYFNKSIINLNLSHLNKRTIKNYLNSYYNSLQKNNSYNKNIDENSIELAMKNILLYKNGQNKKLIFNVNQYLLLEQLNKIDKNDIKKYINFLKQNKINSNKDFYIIDYCQTNKSLEYLYNNNYIFTKNELELIENCKKRSLYEYYLVKYEHETNINKKYNKNHINEILSRKII